MVVIDADDESSFQSAGEWVRLARTFAQGSGKSLEILLAGLVPDFEERPAGGRPVRIQDERFEALAARLDLPFFLVSARTGEGVTELFHEAARRGLQAQARRKAERNQGAVVTLDAKEDSPKQQCF